MRLCSGSPTSCLVCVKNGGFAALVDRTRVRKLVTYLIDSSAATCSTTIISLGRAVVICNKIVPPRALHHSHDPSANSHRQILFCLLPPGRPSFTLDNQEFALRYASCLNAAGYIEDAHRAFKPIVKKLNHVWFHKEGGSRITRMLRPGGINGGWACAGRGDIDEGGALGWASHVGIWRVAGRRSSVAILAAFCKTNVAVVFV